MGPYSLSSNRNIQIVKEAFQAVMTRVARLPLTNAPPHEDEREHEEEQLAKPAPSANPPVLLADRTYASQILETDATPRRHSSPAVADKRRTTITPLSTI